MSEKAANEKITLDNYNENSSPRRSYYQKRLAYNSVFDDSVKTKILLLHRI